jgi:two-component system LytT family response regulator
MTEVLRLMIIDDEPLAREGLRLRLRHEENVVMVGEFADARVALRAILEDAPDVLLLDVEMSSFDGFALVEQLGPNAPAVIFISAHEQHALRAFRVRAIDYLLKPVDQSMLHESLTRAREYLARLRKGEVVDDMRLQVGKLMQQLDTSSAIAPKEYRNVGAVEANSDDQRIPVRVDGVIRFVEANGIEWIEASGDVVKLHAAGATHSVRKSLGEMAAMLPASKFLRIHRSVIVNVAAVRELQPWFHGEYLVILRDGTQLKLSRSYRDAAVRLTGRG